MKFTTFLVGVLATVASAAPAAPAVEARTSFDLSQLNNLTFGNVNLQYLNLVNSLDLQLLAQLGSVNNLNILNFQNLFQSSTFNLQSLLEFQQLSMVLQLAQLGLFNGFDLSTLSFNQLNFGLINGVGGYDINSLIDQSLAPQVAQVVQTGVVVTKE